jgi:hypothetical protein
MDYELSEHAGDALVKRKISIEWLECALISPQYVEPDSEDKVLEHRLAAIPDHGNRVLRVIVNLQAKPARIVTLYFDRRMKGRL